MLRVVIGVYGFGGKFGYMLIMVFFNNLAIIVVNKIRSN